MVFFGKILKEENGFGNNFKEHFLADGESYGGSFYSESNDPFVISSNTQCPRTDVLTQTKDYHSMNAYTP